MKKFKRIIALITVAMFLLSIAAPSAFAATKEDAFGRLNALGVAVGDEKGDPLYDKNFTRAEAAAIMVNLSGMNAAINSAKGATKFKDVSASHWASGVVNLAVGAGIIKGYPDGTYKPDKTVSYAEMSAMLVQVLGYGPKLQGVWPSNVIGKAAQLGILDGVSVTDVNAAAVRANVFLAADNALDTKPLKETKDGYEEDPKTLMEKKLSVTVKDEGTVSGTPAYGNLDKNKVKILYPSGHTPADDTLTTIDGINPDDYYGLKVKAWVKDDKVFFLDVKTDSSDIIVDTIAEINGGTAIPNINSGNLSTITSIKLDKTDKVVSVVYGTTEYKKNFEALSGSTSIGIDGAVKVILGSDGKAKYVLSTSYKNAIVESIDATNEKINLDSDATWTGDGSTIELKDKKVKIYRNNVIAKLADVKKGDVIDYIVSGDIRIIYATDKTATGKLTSVLDDGTTSDGSNLKKFIFKVGDKEYKGAKYTFYSTNNADTFNRDARTGTGDFNSVINKDVTVKLNKSGKAAYIIAGAASDSSEIPAVVKYIKKVSTTDTKRYIYIAKFDGTNTYYEVTKDAKVEGVKISEDALKQSVAPYSTEDGPRILTTSPSKEIKAGDIVKITLNSDNTVNEIKLYGSDLEKSATSFTVSKNNDTFMVSGGTNLAVGSDIKILKVKTRIVDGVDGINATIGETVQGSTYWYDDIESVSWSSLETLDNTVASPAAVVKDGGKAKYILVKDPAVNISTDFFFGVVVAAGTNSAGDAYLSIGYDGKVEDKVGSITSAEKKKVVRFKLKSDGKIDTGYTYASTDRFVYASVYDTFKVDSLTDRQFKLKPVDTTNNYAELNGAPAQYIIIDTAKTKYWDVDASTPATLTSADVVGKYVQAYDVWDKDGKAGTDGVYDFVLMVKK